MTTSNRWTRMLAIGALTWAGCGSSADGGDGDESLSCADATLTIAEVIAAPADHDGDEVVLCADYQHYEQADLDCMPTGTGRAELQEGSYAVQSGSWVLADGDQLLGVMVLGANGVTRISTRPAFEEGQEVVIQGTLRYAVVEDPCHSDLAYNSAYLGVDVARLPIDEGDPPRPPQDAPGNTPAG